jgi:hypothetical protein
MPNELAQARARFFTDPPTIHGVFELVYEEDPEPVRWELWVRWPAFRVETTFEGEPVTFASEDGEVFTSRDDDGVGTGTGFDETGAILLAPLYPFGTMPGIDFPCVDERVLGIQERLGRPVFHVRCPDDRSETWIDVASGLPLAYLEHDTGPSGDGLNRYTSIEFDADIDPALFDAATS